MLKSRASYVMSRRGKCLIYIGGYTFCKQHVSGPKARWVCSTHNHKRCRATVHTIDNEIVKVNNCHVLSTRLQDMETNCCGWASIVIV
uniref:SFRICE_007502 n=1 Tax=Spodoptera frugiperda TaxID=7108 RepID=A0A2H1VTK0_SPOFR